MVRRVLCLGLFALAASHDAGAQVDSAVTGGTGRRDSLPRSGSNLLFGVSVGVPGFGSQSVPEAFTLGVQWTQLRPFRLGADIALGTMPRILAERVAVVGIRSGLTLPVPVGPSAYVVPSGGVSIIGGLGPGGGGGAVGFNGGVSAIAFHGRRNGLRVGVTWHRFAEASDFVWLAEAGFVVRR